AGDADLFAVLLDVGRDEDQRKFGMMISGLQIWHGKAEAAGEVAILLLSRHLLLEHDQAVLVEKILDLVQLSGAEFIGIDAKYAATDFVSLRLHGPLLGDSGHRL